MEEQIQKKGTVKCTVSEDGKFVTACDNLFAVCEDGHRLGKRKGIFCNELTNLETRKLSRRFFFVASGDHSTNGIVLNFCPFCGEAIDSPVI